MTFYSFMGGHHTIYDEDGQAHFYEYIQWFCRVYITELEQAGVLVWLRSVANIQYLAFLPNWDSNLRPTYQRL